MTRAGGFDELVVGAFPALVDESDREDSRPTPATITCPTAVVHGTGDRLIPVENGRRELVAAVPGAVGTFLDGAGHMALREKPAAVGSALRDLLARAKAA